MSTLRNLSLPPDPYHPPPDPVQTLRQPPDDTGRVVFARQLVQRTMPDGNPSEQRDVLNKSHAANSQASHNNASGTSRSTSSTVPDRSQRRSPSPSRGSKPPLTPEESPPFRATRKRSAGIVEKDDKEIDSSDTTLAHTRANSGDSAIHVCICQPDPKIPRPRNAFILYRQHHQASVVSQNPGLANPEISKIIGEQWQNQPPEEKVRWKALAEEEKLRHQQQYPTYRYQPKRNGRRNSLSSDAPGSAGEKPKCTKCGGRTILTPATPYTTGHGSVSSPASVPPTPGSAVTPVTRTLPVLRDLSLQSPAARRVGRSHPLSNMPVMYNSHLDERDDVGPLSPENKRRRYNGDHPPAINHVMPPRYGVAHSGPAIGPGTPFPFGQLAPPHQYPLAAVHARRDSLPGLRGMASPPGPMAPPPRPGIGYQQHRLSQGHRPHDSLTLPPLQTGSRAGEDATIATGSAKTAEEQIMNISFKYKIKVLSQVAPPAPNSGDAPRGPLIAVEGDSAEAAMELAGWLREILSKGDDLAVNLLDGPAVEIHGGKEDLMAQYHCLAADWLIKSRAIRETLSIKVFEGGDSAMTDTSTRDASTQVDVDGRMSSRRESRKIDENYDDSDGASSKSDKMQQDANEDVQTDYHDHGSTAAETMEVDRTSRSSSKRTSTISNTASTTSGSVKSVSIIPNYSLHTSNLFARLISLDPHDPYAPNDHWQWTATQWRGIIGPDLTIYVRDAVAGESGRPSVEIEAVEGRPEAGLFVVRRSKEDSSPGVPDGKFEIEASVLRRLGFEVGEWVRAFGGKSGKE